MALKEKKRNGRSPSRPVRAGKNAPRSERVQISFIRTLKSGKFLLITGSLVVVILLAVGSLYWFSKVYSNPEKVFWGMMNNNLATRGVTKEIAYSTQTGPSLIVTQQTWNPNPRVKSIRQVTYTTTKPPTVLALEGVSTPSTSFQHYSKIDDGKRRDYSSIYNLWLNTQGVSNQQSAPNFNDAVFNVVLFGNLSLANRDPVINKLKNAYIVDFAATGKQTVDGRRVYNYDVELNLQKYAEAAKLYAEEYGLPTAKLINPGSYTGSETVTFRMSVDVLSHQLRKIYYKQSGSTEYYLSYGVPVEITPPKTTVSPQAFQQAIQQITQ